MTDTTASREEAQSFSFKAETKQLLNILIPTRRMRSTVRALRW
jgi:hypothetical protein